MNLRAITKFHVFFGLLCISLIVPAAIFRNVFYEKAFFGRTQTQRMFVAMKVKQQSPKTYSRDSSTLDNINSKLRFGSFDKNNTSLYISHKHPVRIDQPNRLSECPNVSPLLEGNIHLNFETDPPTLDEIGRNNPELQMGGFYSGPKHCSPRNSVAFIVPFRDRDLHLRFFLHYLHLILQRQQTRYAIFVVEQDDDKTFNKAQLMNTGFLYATNDTDHHFDCFMFHDVDAISEDDRTMYRCRGEDEVVHVAGKVDRYQYISSVSWTVGGVIGFREKQFRKINGFSNMFYGWGGEDDDLFYRISQKGYYHLFRPKEDFARFTLIPHKRDILNQVNPIVWTLLGNSSSRQPVDGLNSLDTRISNVIKYKTHTRVYVTVKPFHEENKPYN